MKKTEILDTENCVELINGLQLLINHCDFELERSNGIAEIEKWLGRKEHAKELSGAISDLVRGRHYRQQLAEDRRRIMGESSR